ncbi:GDSL-type esterase/lipase family protein [Dyadobacter sp. 32]|uniref:GDSL-type esterase/lipase family protein n=1 Tax=Dyadobacter sp. 32 TaxID=538966 RepID=UPI0011EE9D72
MRKIRVLTTLGYILLLLITLSASALRAQSKSDGKTATFSPKNGDRVVFLGNSLFENDFQYGYLELALTTRFAHRDLTFRNLGWTGDDVWGDARSTFTNPPTAYQHLMRNIADAKPSIVLLGYGGVEAQEGEAGLPRFRDGLIKLLDKIDSLGAKTILLSPIPVLSADTSIDVRKRNADLELYASAIAKIAADRGKQFIDIYKPIQEISTKTAIIENGVHLNETGYYYLATILEKGMGLTSQPQNTSVHISRQGTSVSGQGKVLASEKGDVKFTVTENYLPLPIPREVSSANDQAHILKFTGLKKGFYTLTANDSQIITASVADWEKGIEIRKGPSFDRAAQIREMIQKKNDLHFFQYRPMNETYIIGFRSYEQGRHVKGLEEQNILITWLEGQIALKKKPKEIIYTLSAVGK